MDGSDEVRHLIELADEQPGEGDEGDNLADGQLATAGQHGAGCEYGHHGDRRRRALQHGDEEAPTRSARDTGRQGGRSSRCAWRRPRQRPEAGEALHHGDRFDNVVADAAERRRRCSARRCPGRCALVQAWTSVFIAT